MSKLSFTTKLENIAVGMQYYAVSVPLKITQALKTKTAVPVSARINGSEPFLASLYPVGQGRHYLRVRNQICKSVGIHTGDRVKVEITVRDRTKEISVPADLAKALRAKGLTANFKALPIGKKSYLLRLIREAVKPETRQKRIQDVLEEARRRK